MPAGTSSTRTGRGTPIGELLIEAGAINAEQLAKALAAQNQNYDLLGRILIRQGACTSGDVLAALQKQYRVTSVDITRVPLDPAALEGVEKEVCEKGRLIPFDLIGSTLCVAMVNVLNRKAIAGLEEKTGRKVKAFNATWVDIRKVIKAYFDEGNALLLEGRPAAAPAQKPAAQEAPPPPPPAPEAPAPEAAAPEAPAPAAPAPAPSPAPEAPAPPAPAPAAEATSAPFTGAAKKKPRRRRRDSMRALKDQLMKEKTGIMKKPAPPPEAPAPAASAPVETPPAPPPPEAPPAPEAPAPREEAPAPPAAEAQPAAAPAVSDAARQKWLDRLVRPVKAEPWVEPLLAKKLRERGVKGAADHEVLDGLPVAEKFAKDVDEYLRTVQTLDALDEVVVELEPEMPASAPLPEVEQALEAPPEEAPAAMAVSEELVSGEEAGAREALPISEEEKQLLLQVQADAEAHFRERFLSASTLEPVRVD